MIMSHQPKFIENAVNVVVLIESFGCRAVAGREINPVANY